MGKIYEALELARKARSNGEPQLPAIPSAILPSQCPELVVFHQPESPLAESFRFLRSKVTRPAAGNPPHTLLVTSAVTGEGKTFVASNLAASISQSIEEHVLLIDADLRNPRVHSFFGLGSNKEGLSTYLLDKAPLAALLRKTVVPKLTVLPSGNSTRAPAELLTSERMKQLIREAGNRYSDRFVIVDSPPLELTSETSVIANEVDAIILVVRHEKTPRQSVQRALGKIQKEKLLGVVYNGYDEPLKYYKRYGYAKGK